MKLGITAHSLGVGQEPEAMRRSCRRGGPRYLGIGLNNWQEPGAIEKVAALRARYGIELETHWGDDFIGNGASSPRRRSRPLWKAPATPWGSR